MSTFARDVANLWHGQDKQLGYDVNARNLLDHSQHLWDHSRPRDGSHLCCLATIDGMSKRSAKQDNVETGD